MSSLGEAFFEVLADTSALGEGIEEGVGDALDGIGDQIGEAFDPIEDAAAEAFGAVGDEASSAAGEATDALAGIEVDDVDGDFSGVVAEAESAAGDVSEAFAGIDEEIQSSIDGISFDGLAAGIEDNIGKVTLGFAAAGAGAEGFARKQLPLREQTQRIGAALGENEETIRDLAASLVDVTRPLDQVLDTMEIGRQQGITTTAELENFVKVWDLVGDATGESASQLAKSSKALAGFNVEDPADALTAFGFIQQETTTGIGEFMDSVQRVLPELGTLDLTIDDAAATMGILEREMGLTGRVARRELQQAVREADGSMDDFLGTLGISAETFAEYQEKVAESSGVIERNAELHAESFTPMQKLQSQLEVLMFRFGGVSSAVGAVAGPLAAMGPTLFGVVAAKSAFAGVLPKVSAALGAVGKSFLALGKIILANPMFLIAALIIGIIAIIWHFRDEIIAALGAAWEWVRDATGSFVDWLREVIPNAIDSLVEWFRELPGRILDGLRALASTVANFVITHHPAAILFRKAREFLPGLLSWFRELPGRIVAALAALAIRLAVTATGALNRFRQAVIDRATAAVDWMRGLPGRIVSAIGNLGSTLSSAGRDLITGLWNGISAMGGWLRDKLLGFVRDRIPGPVAKALGLSSPSKLFAGFGRDLIAGLVQGIEGAAPAAGRAVEDLADMVAGGFPTDIATASAATAPTAARGGSGDDRDRAQVSMPVSVEVTALDPSEAAHKFARELGWLAAGATGGSS